MSNKVTNQRAVLIQALNTQGYRCVDTEEFTFKKSEGFFANKRVVKVVVPAGTYMCIEFNGGLHISDIDNETVRFAVRTQYLPTVFTTES